MYLISVRFEVFTLVLQKIQVFWDITLYGWVVIRGLWRTAVLLSPGWSSPCPWRLNYYSNTAQHPRRLECAHLSNWVWIWRTNGMYSKIPLIWLIWTRQVQIVGCSGLSVSTYI